MRWWAVVVVGMLGAALSGCSDPDSGDGDGAQGGGTAGAAGATGAGAGAGTTGAGGSGGGTGTGTAAGSGGGGGTGTGSGGAGGTGAGSAGSGSPGSAGSGSAGSGSSAGGSGATCGGRGLPPCDDGELCSFPEQASCGEADAPGSCEPIPTACTKELAPVCGCDRVTYSNRCMALAAGVSVRQSGECAGGDAGSGGGDPGGTTCGGIAGLPCPDGQYCDFARGTGCGVADGSGECAVQPSACAFDYNPVCGCDGETYGNACGAAAAGASVDHTGEC